jgi:hypothetical protein
MMRVRIRPVTRSRPSFTEARGMVLYLVRRYAWICAVGQRGVVWGSVLGGEKVGRCVRKLQLVLPYTSCGASFEGLGGFHMSLVGIVHRGRSQGSYGESGGISVAWRASWGRVHPPGGEW